MKESFIIAIITLAITTIDELLFGGEVGLVEYMTLFFVITLIMEQPCDK